MIERRSITRKSEPAVWWDEQVAAERRRAGSGVAAPSAPSKPSARRPRQRRRASHSLDSVLSEAVELLDESGSQGLTFRALAARLGGGVGSIYWYVSSRDELLDRAADHVMAGVLEKIQPIGTDDPIEDLRTIALTVFDAIVDRPWLGAYVLRDTGVQEHSLGVYEKIGQQVLRLDLTPRQRFHAASAIVGFVLGAAADMGQELPEALLSGEIKPEEYMAGVVNQWRALDPTEFPFVHHILDEFAGHDDADQFRAGLDLLLAGLRLQAAG
jgi:AcrR family transcriptional regulator